MTVVAIAHRGEPVGHRENTLPAFAAAVALGADMVEIDLRRTRDGAIVVLHDQTLERLWGLDASVGDVDLADVSPPRGGRRPHPARCADVLGAVAAAADGRLHPARGGAGCAPGGAVGAGRSTAASS